MHEKFILYAVHVAFFNFENLPIHNLPQSAYNAVTSYSGAHYRWELLYALFSSSTDMDTEINTESWSWLSFNSHSIFKGNRFRHRTGRVESLLHRVADFWPKIPCIHETTSVTEEYNLKLIYVIICECFRLVSAFIEYSALNPSGHFL